MPPVNLLDFEDQAGNAPTDEAPTPMVRKDGALVLVSNPNAALELGYKLANAGQVAQMRKAQQDQADYGDSPIKAGLAAAARGASFALSDLALTKSGLVNSGTLKGLEDYNPTASTVGEVAGAIGSTLLAPEASLPGLLERGAAGIAGRATAGLAAEGVAKKIASKALSDAVQGAAYGAGNLLSQQTLGDHELTAEQVMGTVGIGTLLGGTMGAGLTGLGVAARKTLAAAKIPDMLEKAAGGSFSRISGYLSDKDPKEIEQLFQNRLKATISDEERQTVQDQIVQQIKQQDKALSDFSMATTQARPKQQRELLGQQFGSNLTEDQAGALDGMLNNISLSVKKMRDEPEIYTKVGTIRRLETIATALDGNIEGFNKRPDAMYGYMNKIKQKLDELARFDGALPDSERDTVREVRRLRGELKATLEDKSIWGVTGERQGDYNKSANQWLTSQKKFYKQFAVKTTDDAGNLVQDIDENKLHVYLYNLGQAKNGRKEKILTDYLAKSNQYIDAAKQVHYDLNVPRDALQAPHLSLPQDQMETVEANNLLRRLKSPYRNTGAKESLFSPQTMFNVGASVLSGHPAIAGLAGVFGALSNPVSSIEKIVAVEKIKRKAVQMFDTHLDNMLQGKTSDMATILAVDLAGKQHLLKDKESEKGSSHMFQERVNEVNALAQNPELLNNRIAGTTAGMQGIDQVQTQLAGKLGVAVQYLANTAPKNPNVNSITKKPWQPKPSDIMRWNRRLAAVQNPYSVLENPTSEGIDTLKNVYGQIYKEMGNQAIMRISNKPNSEVPYRAKLKLARVFGLDLDRVSNGADLARLQATYNAGNQQQPKRSNRQMKTATQAETSSERLEEKLP